MPLFSLRVLLLHNANDLRAELEKIGADSSFPGDWNFSATRTLRFESIAPKLARFLYQEMMMEGGAVGLPARMDDRSTQPVAVLIVATPRQFQHLAIRLRTQNEDELNILADELTHALAL